MITDDDIQGIIGNSDTYGRPNFTAEYNGLLIMRCTNNIVTGGSGSCNININGSLVSEANNNNRCMAIFKQGDVITSGSSNGGATTWSGVYFK